METYKDEDKHEYYVCGVKKPSVTDICSPISDNRLFSLPEHILKNAQQRGSAIHELCEEYLLTGELDFEDMDGEYVPYMEQFIMWYKTYKPKILYTELVLFGDEFCGTVDLIAELDDKKIIVDYKSTSVIDKKYLSVQFEGYNRLAKLKNINIDEDWYLHLRKDGYTFKQIKSNREWFDTLLKHNKFMGDKYNE